MEQIRAARALIGWSQGELAEEAGLSQTGVARIENGTNHPNSSTIEKIVAAFDKADVEFIGETGVKKRTGEVRTLKGSQGFRQLMNEVYEAAKAGDNNICLFNGVPDVFINILGPEWYDMHAARMRALKRTNFLKIIVRNGEKNLIATGFSEYRWFPEHLFNEKTVYAYGNKLAFLNFNDNDVTIYILDYAEFSDSFRVLFNIAWENVAIRPEKKSF
ncbi:MAG: helix-turn-helix transcriptional regulator [Alphaproteobacteria bacterium]|nr:helix-turn-helix transcriptional regulator [Alphaproteobacteria bacterium]